MTNNSSSSHPFDPQTWFDNLPDDAYIQVRKSSLTSSCLITLMRQLGEAGNHVLVRYDPGRPDKNFTVCINSTRVGDGDNPVEIIETYLATVK